LPHHALANIPNCILLDYNRSHEIHHGNHVGVDVGCLLIGYLLSVARTWVLLIFVIVPMLIMVVAITSPAKGTSLDVSSGWLFFLLAKTLIFSVIGLAAIIVVGWIIFELGIARPNFHLDLLK
jgi:hypothetical protein